MTEMIRLTVRESLTQRQARNFAEIEFSFETLKQFKHRLDEL